MKKVVILDGGLAGLNTALHLQKAGCQEIIKLKRKMKYGVWLLEAGVRSFTF